MTKQTTVLTLCLLIGLSVAGYGYAPVVTVGAAAHAGTGSVDPSVVVFSVGPEVNVDFRTIAGSWGYAAAWYTGRLWYEAQAILIDAHNGGGLLGAQIGAVATELRAGLAYSSRLGDDSAFATPEWNLSADVPLGTLRLGIAIGGLYDIRPDSTGTALTHDLDVSLAVDPSLDLGITTGVSSFVTLWPSQDQTDAGGQGYVTLEGLLGFFTLWNASLSGGIVDSSSETRDTIFVAVDAGIESSALPTLTATGALRTKLASFPNTGDTSLRIEPRAGIDWNPFGGVYLQSEFSAVYGSSSDVTLDGWSVGGSVGIHYRF